MKTVVKVFQEDQADYEITLRLVPSIGVPGGVLLIAVDDEGERVYGGTILTVSGDGIIVSADCEVHGLPKDDMGRIKVRKEGDPR